MLLRRITKHVKDQNWLAVGIDFFIVVVGVFIGIQVANWNDARVEQRELAGQLTSLNAEFSDNLDRLVAYRSLLDHQIDDTLVLREVIADKRPSADIKEINKSLMNIVRFLFLRLTEPRLTNSLWEAGCVAWKHWAFVSSLASGMRPMTNFVASREMRSNSETPTLSLRC